MNKYEKYQASNKVVSAIELADHGGWDTPVCGDCALRMIIEIGRCDHVEYLHREFIPYCHTTGQYSFYSMRGAGLTATDGAPQCEHG